MAMMEPIEPYIEQNLTGLFAPVLNNDNSKLQKLGKNYIILYIIYLNYNLNIN